MNKELITKDLFLHIGLHKTATTYLQHSIFPNIKGVEYYYRSLKPAKLHVEQDKILISNEGMCGCPYLTEGVVFYEQFKISVSQLLNIFKDPKIIICFREPSSFIKSCYKQHLHEGGTLEWDEFFSIENESELDPDDFLFSKYVSFLSKRINNEDLFIYDFDTFKRNPEPVINEMTKFIKGEGFSGDLKKSKRSNSGVPLSLEKPLLTLNRLFGNNLTLSIFGKVISQRTVLQTFIPRYLKFPRKRDLTKIEKHFEKDYSKTKKMISEMNPNLYNEIDEQHTILMHNNY